jgi:hypothetical protein
MHPNNTSAMPAIGCGKVTAGMKLRFGIVFALLAYASVAQAQEFIIGGGVWAAKPSVASFTGPGDAISGATAFYSCARAYTVAYASSAGNLCDIADVGTGATTCTMKAAATGFADLTSALCAGGTQTVSAFCTAHTSCVITKMYDQTVGAQCTAPTTSCDVTQATLASMPALTFGALNGLPCATMVAASGLTTPTPLNAVAAQPFTYALAAKQTTAGTNPNVMGAAGSSPIVFYPTGGTTVGLFAGSTVSRAASLNAYHGLQLIGNGASSAVNVDGTATTGNAGTAAPGTGGNHINIGVSTSMIGSFCEGGLWPIAFSAGQQTSWFSNANGSSGYNGGL